MGNIHFTLGKSEFFVQKYNPPPKNPGGVFKFCPNIKTGGFFFIGRGGLIVDVKISGGVAEKGTRKINKKNTYEMGKHTKHGEIVQNNC